MYSSLRPEIRAAQRVLRSIHPPYESFKPTHRTVRSFSSYTRLQAQSGNGGDHSKPETPKDSNPPASVAHKLHEFLRSFSNNDKQTASPTNDDTVSVVSLPHTHLPDIDFAEIARKGEAEKKEIDEALRNGSVPAGYRIITDQKDVPENLRFMSKPGEGLRVPFLLSDDPTKLVKGYSLPKDFGNLSDSKAESEKQKDSSEKQETDQEEPTKPAGSNNYLNTFYGSSNARRKRPRTSKHAPVSKEQTPSWLLDNNLNLTQLPVTNSGKRRIVLSTYQEGDDRDLALPIGQEKGQQVFAEVSKDKARVFRPTIGMELSDNFLSQSPQESKDSSAKTSEKALSHGSAGPGGSNDPTTPLSPAVATTEEAQNRAYKSFLQSRYYIENHQWVELEQTFNGRLRRFSDPALSAYPGPAAANHLAIYHSGKDTELLLYTLVEELCSSGNADLLRLDAQDISALMAQSDNDSEISSRGARASFSIFKNIYGTHAGLFDPSYPSADDFDDIGEDDDEANPRGSVEIPVASFVALPGSGMPKGFLDGIRKKVFGSGGPLSGFLDQQSGDSHSRFGIFTSTVDSLLSSTTRKIQSEYSRHSKDKTSISESDQASEKELSHRPLVVHIPDVGQIQANALTGAFLSELLQAADASTKAGRHVMVVGTDVLRDTETHTSRSILNEQENRVIESATAIVLTPILPRPEARLFLLEDRKLRTAAINARHLWAVLHNARGILLRGLEAGFWTRDFSKEMGKQDFEALTRGYLSYSKVQRIASILGSEEMQKQAAPISDAMRLIELSDESKTTYFSKRTPQMSLKAEIKAEESPENKRLAQIRSAATKHEKKLLSGVIEPNKISTTFQDIHIATETVETLQTLTTLSLLRPEAFRYGVLKSDRIPGLLLYGPPGTGKTLAAKAVAKESGATMLEVSAADLNDMYVGEGEKNVQALFSLAKKLSPCVVFLDEADAMFSARQAQGRRVSHRELLNQFLKEWDGMSNDSGSAFIMVATNRPMDLDDAVLRRLPRRILVDLPTEKDRLEILKIHLRQESLADDVNLADLAKKTPFYSGSDLKNVAVAAALRAVREEHDAAKKHAKENPEGEAYQFPERRILTNAHFEKALEEISASISEDMTTLKDIRKFDEQYGDKRGKRKKTPKWGFRSPADAVEKKETVKVRAE